MALTTLENIEASFSRTAAELDDAERIPKRPSFDEAERAEEAAARTQAMLAAFRTCVESLEPLTPTMQTRALRAVAELLGVRL